MKNKLTRRLFIKLIGRLTITSISLVSLSLLFVLLASFSCLGFTRATTTTEPFHFIIPYIMVAIRPESLGHVRNFGVTICVRILEIILKNVIMSGIWQLISYV